ncbi:MAG: hypothetical protein GY814_08700, partial [Gammaproteobacteria bacterium]|nr:hypothetical protein [Gammaproteobacteria bacterium]
MDRTTAVVAEVPNTMTIVPVATASPVLIPLVSMDFSEQAYVQNETDITFDDLFVYTRDSSSSFWNRRLNQSGEWESFLDTDYVGDVENLAHYSEDFTNWTAQGLSVIPNATTNPVDGLMTADHLVESTGMTHQIDSNTIDLEQYKIYTASFYVKQTANNRNVYLSVPRDIIWNNQAVAVFDTTTGEVLSVNSYAYAAASTYEGDGWFRVSLIVEPYGTDIPTVTAKLYLADGEDILYTSDGVSGVYAFGGQLTQSEKPLSYVATTTAAVTESFTESPLFEYDPVTFKPMGVAIWEEATNYLAQSESFYTDQEVSYSWEHNCYLEPHAAIAPDGTMSMRKISSYDSVNRNIDPSVFRWVDLSSLGSADFAFGDQCTFSIFVKADDVDFAQMSMQDGQRVNFGLTNVEKGEQSTYIDNATIKDCGNGIRRLSCTVTINNSYLICEIGLTDSLTGAYNQGVTFPDDVGFFIWGAMLNKGPIALPYVRTPGTPDNVYTVRAADDLRMYSENNISLADMSASVEFKIDAVGLERCLFNIPVRPSVSEWDTIAIHLSSAGVLKFQRG